jgi:protein-tyrosine phosphatase
MPSCCTVNFPQGWPKFITNAFLLTADKKSLVQLYLGPFETKTILADGLLPFSLSPLLDFIPSSLSQATK